LIGLLVVTVVSAFAAVSGNQVLPMERAHMKGELWNDIPVNNTTGVRGDTVWYGDYQIISGEYYARSLLNDKNGVKWTFDRGNGPINPPAPVLPNGEGFVVRDLTANTTTYFRVIDNTLNLGVGVPAPIITGSRSLWVGADKPQADALCWTCGAGYGNAWCQRVSSPALAYNGSGAVNLSFKYFIKSEPCFDGTQVYLRRTDNTEVLLNPYPPQTCTNNLPWDGGFTDSIGAYNAPATYTRSITQGEIGGAQNVRIIFEFLSDGGWSDEDGDFCTIWGPMSLDDLSIVGGGINVTEGWEGGLNGWTPGLCDPVGHYISVVDVGPYTILDPCACKLEGNVVEMHDGLDNQGTHPVGQHVWIESPICDLGNSDVKTIFMEFDMYAEMPQENGVLFRPGWEYSPWTCIETGAQGWSGRVGQNAYNYSGADPVCATWRYGGTDLGIAGTPVPNTSRYVRLIMELEGDCSAFTIDPCSNVTNFTPLFDNLAVGVTAGRLAPIINFDTGGTFQDVGSYPSTAFDPRAAGPANVTHDAYMDNAAKPDYSGDSLIITGPIPSPSDPNTRWEARMWWRVAKRSPFNSDRANNADTRYKTWKDRVADGKLIDRPYKPQFTFGWMDSQQVGFVVTRNKFISTFRENDDDFIAEGNPDNEMIWDDVLFPGSRIQYFMTSNYAGTPNSLYYLPDTTGGNFFEFEVLPGVETANVNGCGGTGFNFCAFHPATLYIDAFNGGSQFYVENALRTVLNGSDPCLNEDGCVIPYDRNWDRYDMLDGSSNWNAGFARGAVAGSNNGMTLQQILGYKAILLNTGTYSSGATEETDYQLYDQWLISPLCESNINPQVFLFNGDKVGEVLSNPAWPLGYGLSFLNNTLGATLLCDAFNGVSSDPDCAPPTLEYCVRWLQTGGSFPTELDVDAFGSYCPNLYGFNVYDLQGGTGNRSFLTESGDKSAVYGQVTNTNVPSNYKTVLDGVSWNHMTRRNAGGSGLDKCPRDVPSIVAGSLNEIGAALKWGFGAANYGGIPKLTSVEVLATCQSTWGLPADVGDNASTLVNRLYQNEPNPFNPRTTIKFSLAQNGPVQVLIYDVNGRLIKTLQDGNLAAGPHTLTWDGTNNDGKHVGSGVFWSQMKAGSFVSNKKMVILK
jgi:hypothetical protein